MPQLPLLQSQAAYFTGLTLPLLTNLPTLFTLETDKAMWLYSSLTWFTKARFGDFFVSTLIKYLLVQRDLVQKLGLNLIP